MFSRKLEALNHHSPKAEVPLGATEDVKPLIVWLEDQKIRHLKIEERNSLRESTGKEWVTTFKKYLKSLECPYRVEMDLPAVVDWLLGVALRYEYEEAANSNADLKRGIGEKGSATSLSRQISLPDRGSPLDISPTDETFISGTQALAKLLKIAPHHDPTVILSAAKIVIQEKLMATSQQTDGKDKERKGARSGGKEFAVTAKECGFELGDPVLSEAAKVLRLLHLQELRQLQTRINEIIVAVQQITADPKTNQALGKVGR